MNLLLLYFLLAKASVSSFTGLSSLPVVQADLVRHHHVLTDRQLNAAVAVGQTVPGANGVYIVSVGYFVAGWPGAVAGYVAMLTPAFLIIPMLRYLGERATDPRVRQAIQAVTVAAVGLLLNAIVPLARDAVNNWLMAALAAGGFLFISFTRRSTLWAVLGAALVGLLASLAR